MRALGRLLAAAVDATVAHLEAVTHDLEEYTDARRDEPRSRYWRGFEDGVAWERSLRDL